MTTIEKGKMLGGKPMTKEQEQEAIRSRKQYYASKTFHVKMKGVAFMLMLEVKEQHPDWTLNQVLADILGEINPEFPPSLLLAITQTIIEEWVETEKEEPVFA